MYINSSSLCANSSTGSCHKTQCLRTGTSSSADPRHYSRLTFVLHSSLSLGEAHATREIVAFNFAPSNSTQAASAMKTGQGDMDWFCCSEESTSSRRVIFKIKLRIKQPQLNLVTVGRDSSFPSPPGAGKGMPWLSHSVTTVSIPKTILQKGK